MFGHVYTPMVCWHRWLNEHELEQTQRDRKGQGKTGLLQFMQLQRVWNDLVTEEQQWKKHQDKTIFTIARGILLVIFSLLFVYFKYSHTPLFPVLAVLSVGTDSFTISRMLYKQNHTVYTLLCLVSFTQHNYSEIYPCSYAYQ